MKSGLWAFVLLVIAACKVETRESEICLPKPSDNLDDKAYIKNMNFPYGDVRRYGIFPETLVPQKELQKLLRLAQQGVPLLFPSGYYPINLRMEGATDISIQFENVELGGELVIIELENRSSSRIALKGRLKVLDRVFMRHSGDILLDTLLIHSDEKRNIHGNKNRGLSIYAGSRNIGIDYLEVFDTGGESTKYYQYVAAAVQLHGWNNNPRNVRIRELRIRNTGRSGLYLTGYGHRIEMVEVLGFGSGSNKQVAGLDDAPPGSTGSFSGVWLNKCENCDIDTVRISNHSSKDQVHLRLGPGEAFKPAIIHNLLLSARTSKIKIEDSELTNVIIKNVIGDEMHQ
jgi:hypothetical protein